MVPLHPQLSHLPLGLTFVLPFLIVGFAFFIRANKMHPKTWLMIVGLQLVVVIAGYISLETGETEEHSVEKIVGKEYVQEHEKAAEIFVGSSVLVLVFSVAAFFLRKELGFPIKLFIAFLSLISAFTGYRTGKLGGELVYVHGAAQAHLSDDSGQQGILPTPGLQTSESPAEDNNESLKVDDSDYESSDALPNDDDEKVED